MMIYNGKEYRNLQEQVQKNKEDIEQLQQGGIDVDIQQESGTSTTAIMSQAATTNYTQQIGGNVLGQAKSYTDTKASSVLSSAINYTDGKIEIVNAEIEDLKPQGKTYYVDSTTTTSGTTTSGTTVKTSQICTTNGYYSPTGVFTANTTWKCGIVSYADYTNLQTYAGGSTSSTLVPAFINIENSISIGTSTTSSNINSYFYGETATTLGPIKKGDKAMSDVATSGYVIINYFSKLDDTCVCEGKGVAPTDTYATIAEALAVATGEDTIMIAAGTYNEYHLNLPKGITMIGKDKETTIINGEAPEDIEPTTLTSQSTLECNKGATLKNLTIVAKNLRYPIHADFSSGAKAKWNMFNCHFIHKGNEEAYDYQASLTDGDTASIFTACSAWGGGTYGGDEVYCEDCTFESVGRGFSTHNNTGTTYTKIGPSKVKLVNCDLISSGINKNGNIADFPSPLFVQNLASGVQCSVVLSNCRINGYVVFQSSGDYWTNQLRLYNCGNLKTCFSTYGSGQSDIGTNNLISTYASHYDGYAYTNNIKSLMNRGTTAITKGSAIKKSGSGIALCTTAEDIYGVALQDIAVKGIGDCQIGGYISRIYLDGVRTTTLTEGNYIYLLDTGKFAATGTDAQKVFKITDNQNIVLVPDLADSAATFQ